MRSNGTYKKALQEALKGKLLSLGQVFIGEKHIGGAEEIKQMHEYGELVKLVEDNLKRNVGASEVYVATHKKNDKFSSKKAEKIYETFEKLKEQARESQNEEGDGSSSQKEGDLWCQATGGVQHERIFGLGTKQQAVGLGVSVSSSFVQSPYGVICYC